jgi:hypothetical protein
LATKAGLSSFTRAILTITFYPGNKMGRRRTKQRLLS